MKIGQKLRWTFGGALLGASAVITAGTLLRPTGPAMAAPAAPPDDGKLRILVFGAHPDDAEIRASGGAAKWAARGHHVKFVRATNGDIGHWKMAGGPLANRRTAEVKRCAEILGITNEVLDIHDGEIMPTLENRRTFTRLIRDWKADIVISHRPNDYHPDHRYTGVLMQDSAYMVTVPFFCPDVPYLTKNPVYMYAPDGFQKPNPFHADVAIGIDDVIEKKLDCMDTLESQFYEGGANGGPGNIPSDPNRAAERKRAVRNGFANGNAGTANRYRTLLKELYGDEAGDKVKYAEAFEVCEYGARPNRDELKRLFPVFGAK